VLEANLGEAACVTRAHDNNGRAASAGLTTTDEAVLGEAAHVGSGGTTEQRNRQHRSKTMNEVEERREATAGGRPVAELKAPTGQVEEERRAWIDTSGRMAGSSNGGAQEGLGLGELG
jgi:hypothetical protein